MIIEFKQLFMGLYIPHLGCKVVSFSFPKVESNLLQQKMRVI